MNISEATMNLASALSVIAAAISVTTMFVSLRERVKQHAETLQQHSAEIVTLNRREADARSQTALILQRVDQIAMVLTELKEDFRCK